MANYTTMSLSATKYLCGLIRDLASVSDGILDTAICTDKTFSSYYIDLLLKQLKADSEAYTDEVASALTKLTAEVVTVEPTLDNTTNKINTILLYSPNGNDVYDQYLRLETQLISLGSTQISMADYIKTSEADNKYSTKTELKAVTDKIGTTTLTTTAQTLTGSIEEVKGIAEQGTMLTVTKEQYDQLVAGQTVTIGDKDYTYDDNTYYVVKNDGDTIVTTSTINSSSTNSEVPTAKAVNDSYHLKTYTSPEQLGITSYFIPDIIEAMPMGSKFEMGLLNNNPIFLHVENLMPNTSGLIANNGYLEIIRGDSTITEPNSKSYRFRVMYTTNTDGVYGDTYIAQVDMKNKVVKKWEKICTTSVADVPLTSLAANSWASGAVYYRVKNGTCHVWINGLSSATMSTNGQVIVEGLPIPENPGIWYGISSNSATSGTLLVQISASGAMINYVGVNNQPYFDSFSYPVAES